MVATLSVELRQISEFDLALVIKRLVNSPISTEKKKSLPEVELSRSENGIMV